MNLKIDILQILSTYIANHQCLDEKLVFKLLEKPKDPSHGEIALPCFQLAKVLGKKPNEVATEIASLTDLPKFISNISNVGPFLNFKLNFKEVASLLLDKEKNTSFDKKLENIIVEYSSPNIAKPFHVGHLRATLIGNALDRIYRFAGYNVDSINHLGDWGTQFGFVYAGCKIWGEPDNYSVSSLVELYKKATGLKEEQERATVKEGEVDVNSLARGYFIDLEKGEEYAVTFWKKCVDTSLVYLKDTYERMNIKFDHYLGESFYSDKLEAVENDLKKSGILTESQGALGVDLGEKLGFARVLTPDGRSLYLSRDLAAAEYRFNRFNFSKSLYVVGAPQSLHFQQIIGVLSKLNKPYADSILHIAFGHVLGMKTRGDGKTIELNEFLDEAERLALEAYQTGVERRPEGLDETEVSKKVALSAIIFSTLNRNNIKDVTFKWEDALSFQGDSGPYLLYAYARLKGIEEKASKENITGSGPYNLEALETEGANVLLTTILDFETSVLDTIKENEPLILCQYALNLAKSISKAYLDLKVLGTDSSTANTRLALFKLAGEKLKTSLNLLGIEVLDRM
jgi:arginyl-tRNA synthetase